MRIEVHSDDDAAATAGAKFIAAQAREAVATRGRFVMAVSGGHVPWQMFRILANEKIPWQDVHVVQVDERAAPAGDQDRNLTHLRESLLSRVPLPSGQFHAMPVEKNDLEAAAASYANLLWQIAGSPPVNGPEKAEILQHLAGGDESIPAGRIQRDTAVVLA